MPPCFNLNWDMHWLEKSKSCTRTQYVVDYFHGLLCNVVADNGGSENLNWISLENAIWKSWPRWISQCSPCLGPVLTGLQSCADFGSKFLKSSEALKTKVERSTYTHHRCCLKCYHIINHTPIYNIPSILTFVLKKKKKIRIHCTLKKKLQQFYY